MKKQEFIDKLSGLTKDLTASEREKAIQFYTEIIEDKIESGISEEEAVAQLGSPTGAAQKIKTDMQAKSKKTKKIILISTCVIWVPFLLTMILMVFSIYLVLWTVIITGFCAVLSFACVFLEGILTLFMVIAHNLPAAVLQLGIALFCGGAAILSYMGMIRLTKLFLHYSAKSFRWMKNYLIKAVD